MDRDAYLRELCRYVVLNPVRAGLADDPAQWLWSSYSVTVGETGCPAWLACGAVCWGCSVRKRAMRGATIGGSWRKGLACRGRGKRLAGQIFLGGEDFLKGMQEKASAQPAANVSAVQRLPARPSAVVILEAVGKAYGLSKEQVLDRSSGLPFREAVYLLRRRGNLPLREVAGWRVYPPRVSRTFRPKWKRRPPTDGWRAC